MSPVAIQGKTPIAVAGELIPPPEPPPEPPPPPPKPPEPPPRVELRDNRIEIREKIQFEYNKAVIREVSFDLIDEIARVIKKNPHIKKLRIEGHASAEGEDRYNKTLSDRRAHAVMDHLVQRGGVPSELLIAKGYGEERPIASNDTEENREKNRRVEFNIVEQDITKKTVEIDSSTGSEKVVAEVQQSVKAADADEADESVDLSAAKATAPKTATSGSGTATSAKGTAKPAAKTTKPPKAGAGAKPAKPAKPAVDVKASKPSKAAKPAKANKPTTSKPTTSKPVKH
jgi:OOP family OmpA-OmpF porin